MMNRILLIALSVLFVTCRTDPGSTGTMTEVNQKPRTALALNWYAEVEHGGYLAAKAEKIFERADLDVTIIPGGPDVPVMQRVVSGDVDFGIANADEVLLARNQQVPVVALMAPIQHTPLCIMVHEESGITQLVDLKNVVLAITPTSPQSLYLHKRLPLENVRIVPYGGSVAPFLADKSAAQQGYIFSEPIVAQSQGAKTRCLSVATIGFDPYASILITSETTLKTKPDLVRRMVTASLAGWETYMKDPVTTHAYIQKLNPQMTEVYLSAGHKVLKDLVQTADKAPLGSMTLTRWQHTLDQLVEIGLIPAGEIKAESAFLVHR